MCVCVHRSIRARLSQTSHRLLQLSCTVFAWAVFLHCRINQKISRIHSVHRIFVKETYGHAPIIYTSYITYCIWVYIQIYKWHYVELMWSPGKTSAQHARLPQEDLQLRLRDFAQERQPLGRDQECCHQWAKNQALHVRWVQLPGMLQVLLVPWGQIRHHPHPPLNPAWYMDKFCFGIGSPQILWRLRVVV